VPSPVTLTATWLVPSEKVTVPVPLSSSPPTVNETWVDSAPLMTLSPVASTTSVAVWPASVSRATLLPVALAGLPTASVKESEELIGPSVSVDRLAL